MIRYDLVSGLKGPRLVGANREEESPCHGRHAIGCLEQDYVGRNRRNRVAGNMASKFFQASRLVCPLRLFEYKPRTTCLAR